MSRWSSSLWIPIVAVAILIGSILTGGRADSDPQGRPVVVYAHPPCPPDLMRYFEEAFADFRQSHPEINLQVLHITGNYEDKIKVMFAGKVAPDVIFMYPTALPAWVELGALRPLNDLLGTNVADYFAAGVRTFSYRGRIYGLPKDATADILFYNPALFRQHGLTTPSADWTWQEMLRAAKAMTEDRDGDGRTDVYGMQQPEWQSATMARGVCWIRRKPSRRWSFGFRCGRNTRSSRRRKFRWT